MKRLVAGGFASALNSALGQPVRSGSWKAWFDGYGSSHTDTLSQSVSIPAGCRATLSFYLHIDTAETTSTTAYDKLTVRAGSTTLATYSNLNRNTGYALGSFDVSSLAGQTVTISLSVSRTPRCRPASSSTTRPSPWADPLPNEVPAAATPRGWRPPVSGR